MKLFGRAATAPTTTCFPPRVSETRDLLFVQETDCPGCIAESIVRCAQARLQRSYYDPSTAVLMRSDVSSLVCPYILQSLQLVVIRSQTLLIRHIDTTVRPPGLFGGMFQFDRINH